MEKEKFTSLINRLVEVEPTSSPLISCFVDLEHPRSDYFSEIEDQASMVAKRLSGLKAIDFEDALEEIREYLESKIKPSTKSVAIYSRWGERPVFLPMQFEESLKTEFIVDELPHIYPLIELKDTSHRLVIAILTERETRILETAIGFLTEDILEKQPALRGRINRGWSKEHYHSYLEEHANRFVEEKTAMIENLMNHGIHNHLVLTGSPKIVARIKKALPPQLQAKAMDTPIAKPGKGLSPILADSINLFIAMENVESHGKVMELETAVFANGLGVCGYDQSLESIDNGSAGMLIIDQNFLEPELQEELVRHASKLCIPIETVNRNETMIRLGGVGCLLRYLPTEVHSQRVMLVA